LDHQSFGFLGPAALTRVYLSGTAPNHQDTGKNHHVTLLPPEAVTAATQSSASTLLALHLVGKERKNQWQRQIRGSIVEDLVQNLCASLM